MAAAAGGYSLAGSATEVLVREVKNRLGPVPNGTAGLDRVAFAGRIGEDSASLREGVCRDMDSRGMLLDQEKYQAPKRHDCVISRADWEGATLEVNISAEAMVAREKAACVGEE